MLQIILAVFAGILFGISLSLLIFNVITAKELRYSKRLAMFAFYKEILNKKQDSSYEYSHDARRIINAAHLRNMSKW
ncbi:MAG TPA: hypothetical protein EYG68_11910 [Leucothrix mucor]|nr:hypothetical protein [Leucothrix mucor]